MKYRNDLKRRVLAGLFAGAALCLAAPAALAAGSPVPNGTLPDGGHFMVGGEDTNIVPNQAGNQMNITQSATNAVIKWDSFNVGANATVNFEKDGGGNFNTLNYVNSENGMSQIYGNINAENGNIYIVNPAGVEIGNSAQINVGSLYVSNRNLDGVIKENMEVPEDMAAFIQQQGVTTDSVLMSLGNINASNVTFDGARIVIDTERLKDAGGDNKLVNIEKGLTIRTTDADNVVIGYKGYDEEKKAYNTQDVTYSVTKINDDGSTSDENVKGYMWVEDVEQLQAIKDNPDGNYALRNSIDATATQDTNFTSIGDETNHFNGRFDGLDYNIFNLNIDHGTEENVGLFGVVGGGAVINNVTLVGGSITGGSNVGALAGFVQGGAHISNITNSASVTGTSNVGGIAGSSGSASWTGLINTGTIKAEKNSNGESNAGGLIGSMNGGTLNGTSYNLGSVTGSGSNVGGLVGYAEHATIGNEGENAVTVYNRLNVTGAYNVGGIVGNMVSTTVQNAENSGNVIAEGNTIGEYIYHSATTEAENGVRKEYIRLANSGGIAGSASGKSEIKDVLNTGNVNSIEWNIGGRPTENRYTGGNVGGIVGSAVNTNITNATNRENEVRGSINVGGIAGYFANSDNGTYKVTNGVNDGGDIMASGQMNSDGRFVTETVRPVGNSSEEFIVGNMGGIVGYMDGDNVYITSSANRGTVHTHEPESSASVQTYEKAANVGGIVGKIDRSGTKTIDAIKGDAAQAAVSNSYNTGDVMGYTGVGGIAGMMYNGEIAGSYNLGYLRSTRQTSSNTGIEALNMGGIVGDTTENSGASVVLYDVYNKGQIGDAEFRYYGRHVGGIVGRLSGTVEKAYNTGAIYNGYNVVGGIAGWMSTGSINNAFNTGNITVVNRNNGTSQVGGIVGAASTSNADITLNNVYNLGTLRSFKYSTTSGGNTVGGILGIINQTGRYQVSITNAYTTGNIWAGTNNGDDTYSEDTSDTIRSIWGDSEVSGGTYNSVKTENTYYIMPDTELQGIFTNLHDENNIGNDRDNSNHAIAFGDKDNADSYQYTKDGTPYSLSFTEQQGGDVDGGYESATAGDNNWRIYEGSTPILNAFLPNAEEYFAQYESETELNGAGIGSIQYGTAYDPLLTIINANVSETNPNLEFNWQELGINNDAGLAVYGAGLTLNDFMATGGSGYFGGLIYSDGELTLNAYKEENPNITGDVALGSASKLYGSSVTIEADGQVTIYGNVTATGNIANGATDDKDDQISVDVNNVGNLSITGGSVDIYGQLTSSDGNSVTVPGISGMASGWTPGPVNDPHEAMSDIGNRFGHTTGESVVNSNISITANDEADGHVNVYYGNKGEGLVTTAGDLTVTASGDIYMDSDLSIDGNLTLEVGDDSEAVLDISNIGKVQAEKGTVTDALKGLHNFLNHFAEDGKNITLKGGETKIAVDMWGTDSFDLTKYDYEGETLADRINELNLSVNGNDEASGQDYTYIWVSTGEQLKGIQQYKKKNSNSNILSYNFALKNDIDASDVTDYEAIASGEGESYTGIFDGRDNRIIGLDTTKRTDGKTLINAGIFDNIGIGKNADGTEHVGTVEDLRVYSGTFSGTDNAGAVAGVNKGTISNVTAFGNVVDVKNQNGAPSYAGGIAGMNGGTIDNASAIGTATQSSTVTDKSAEAAAGGIAGLNRGTISNSTSNSAVNASAGDATALGGVAGVNEGTFSNVDSLGVTTGVYKVEGQNTLYSDNVGGIAGTNSGKVENAYNESIVSGRDNVGGILGKNSARNDKYVFNVANASSVTGEADANATEDKDKTSDYVGGLVGNNEGSITNGRNNGEITGNNYVGGLVGANGENSTLTNLVNDESAAITGDNYVGGIAGSNAGKITADEKNNNLINRGTITGQMYVGGVAGENYGTIANTHNDVELHVRYEVTESNPAKYFGGVAGINGHLDEITGQFVNTGKITSATNTNDIIAPDADYVGGIVGWNPEGATLNGMGNSNEGRVEGASHVGGVAGKNDAAITGSLNNMVGIKNSGVVIAHTGGAGGIFGENTGKIEYAEITNNGIVSGTAADDESKNGTGGIFGVNSGDVTHSSLKNEIGGQVMGTQNVGGLIGVNSGTITGGRDENDGYYKYQIYNNGTIMAGTWGDTDKDGNVDKDEWTPANGNSQNIGGLIGSNVKDEEKTGSLTAGYNTGAIIADSSTNVGGIAGTNAGTLDQVFNTVITADGQNQTITGSTSVGGIAGINSGTISNAYNTTAVTGINDTGSIAGSSTGIVENVYATVSGSLVGNGGVIKNDTGYVVTDNDQWKQSSSYNGFDFDSTDTDGTESIWKIYEGSTNPLLKVFLTKVTIDDSVDLGLVYNGKDQDIKLDGFISNAGISAADKFQAYMNNNSLIQNTSGEGFEHKNAGKYDNWLYSGQIAASNDEDGFNPNNLGYDIDFKQDIDKAVIKVEGNTVDRTYGSSNISDNGSYGFIVSGGNNTGELTSEMKQELTAGNLGFDSTQVSDGALSTETGRVTNDVSDNYTWSANLSLGDALNGNYVFEAVEGQDGTTITVTGQSHVNKADLNITAGSDTIYVGGTPDFSSTATVDPFVNGDSFQLDFGMSTDDADLPHTVGKHTGVVGFWHNGTFYGTQAAVDTATDLFGGNYNVKFTPGTLTVRDFPEGMPEISDIPSIERHWNFLFDDDPWGRNRDFRERKANIHFIAGGMTL